MLPDPRGRETAQRQRQQIGKPFDQKKRAAVGRGCHWGHHRVRVVGLKKRKRVADRSFIELHIRIEHQMKIRGSTTRNRKIVAATIADVAVPGNGERFDPAELPARVFQLRREWAIRSVALIIDQKNLCTSHRARMSRVRECGHQ